jgi:1-phosphofructokinase family hexose kinase
MILAVNPNLALDRVVVTDYVPRSTLRPRRSLVWPGGSGTHAALVARQLGAQVLVVGFAGGHIGALLRDVLREHRLPAETVAIAAETRETFSLLDAHDGNLCDVAEAGPAVGADEAAELLQVVLRHLDAARLLLLAGSLPPGCPPSLYADLIAAAGSRQIPVVADLAGDALLEAVRRGVWLVKPSLDELRELRESTGEGDVLDLAHAWHQRGVANVCVSLGAGGALWVSAHGTYRLEAPPEPAFNSIGCGDAMVGAIAAWYLSSGSAEEALRAGVAAATANLRYDAPGFCTRDDIDRLLPDIRMRPL